MASFGLLPLKAVYGMPYFSMIPVPSFRVVQSAGMISPENDSLNGMEYIDKARVMKATSLPKAVPTEFVAYART